MALLPSTARFCANPYLFLTTILVGCVHSTHPTRTVLFDSEISQAFGLAAHGSRITPGIPLSSTCRTHASSVRASSWTCGSLTMLWCWPGTKWTSTSAASFPQPRSCGVGTANGASDGRIRVIRPG